MTIWPPDRDNLSRPFYHSLAQALVRAVEAGEIAPGTRLPTHRALAYDLGVSVQTVSRAYEELTRIGIIAGKVGRGSFVTAGAGDQRTPWQQPSGDEQLIDCSMLMPVTGEIHAEAMAAALSDLAGDLPLGALFSFRPRATLLAHCDDARDWLVTCGLDTSRERIVPTNGNTQAMTIALMTAALPGDLILTEEVGHHTLLSLTASLGLKLSGLAIDDEGILPDAFDRACRNSPVKALCLMPGGLGPTSALMGEERRNAIVALARKHDVWIIENDAWGPLATDRPAPLAARAPERTFYFTGLSKCILPGLRIAWLVVPEARVSAARTRHLVTNWMATPLIAEIASRWIADGTAARLMAWQQDQLRRRNRMVAQAFGGLSYRGNEEGLHVWLPLPDPWREDDFVALARHDGVAVAPGASFSITGPGQPPAIRICIGAGTESDLGAGLRVLSRLVRSAPEPGLLAI